MTVGNAAYLKQLLSQIDDAFEIERLINEVGLFSLGRVLNRMGSGKQNIVDVEIALDAQKQLDNKILYGEQKGLTPGTADYRTIRGGHSPRILGDPNFTISSQTVNADGTIEVKFQKLVDPGPPPVWSKSRTSTLAPPTWSDEDILVAGDQVASTPAVQIRSDGTTFHLDTVNGVQWEVIKDSSGNVVSSFPVGAIGPVF